MPSRGKRRARNGAYVHYEGFRGSAENNAEQTLEDLERFNNWMNRPPAWLPPELQVQICREMVLAYLRRYIEACKRRCIRLAIPYFPLYITRDGIDARIDRVMGPLKHKQHLRYDAAKLLLSKVPCYEEVDLAPSNYSHGVDVPGFVESPFEFSLAPELFKHVTDLQIGIAPQLGLAPSLGGYHSICENLKARLSRITQPSAFPAVQTLTIAVNLPIWFSNESGDVFFFPEDILLGNVITGLRKLPIEHRRISLYVDRNAPDGWYLYSAPHWQDDALDWTTESTEDTVGMLLHDSQYLGSIQVLV